MASLCVLSSVLQPWTRQSMGYLAVLFLGKLCGVAFHGVLSLVLKPSIRHIVGYFPFVWRYAVWCDVSVPFCHFCSLEPGRVSVIIPCSLCYVKDIKQPSFPTPFYSVLVSIPFFMAFSTVFLSINSPDNSPPSHCSSRLNSALSQFRALFLLPASHIQLTQGKLN